MFRTLFFLLILANLLFFVWTQGYFGVVADGREPQRLGNQLTPEKLRVVGLAPPNSRPQQLDQNCRLVSGLTQSEAQQLTSIAKEKLPGLQVVARPKEAPANVFWVFIPPLANRPAVDKKAAELKKRDVREYSVILEEGADKFAILLGQFNTERAASEYLQELVKRDVRSARVEARVKQPEQAQLEIRGAAELLTKQLPELLNGKTAATIVDCPAGR